MPKSQFQRQRLPSAGSPLSADFYFLSLSGFPPHVRTQCAQQIDVWATRRSSVYDNAHQDRARADDRCRPRWRRFRRLACSNESPAGLLGHGSPGDAGPGGLHEGHSGGATDGAELWWPVHRPRRQAHRRYRTSAKANCHRCVRQHGQGAGMVERPHGPGAARRSQQTRPDARLCRRGDCQLGGPGARFARRASVSPGPPTQVSHRLGRHELGQPARRWLACARMIEGGAMTACGPFETCADGVCRSAYGARSVLGQCASYC